MKRLSDRVRLSCSLIALLFVVFHHQPISASTNLVLWHCWGDARHPEIQAQVDSFARNYKDVNVEVVNMNCRDITERFQVAHAAGIAPDIIMIRSAVLPVAAIQGLVKDITDEFHQAGFSDQDFIGGDYSASTWKERVYGIPIRTGSDENTLIYYSTDAFYESGLDIDSPPEKWSELIDIGKKLTVYDGTGLRRSAIHLERNTYADFVMTGWLYSGDGKMISDDGTRIIVADSNGLDAMFEFKQIFDILSSERVSTGTRPEIEFVYGQTAMMMGGGRAFEIIQRADSDFEFRMAVKPHRDNSDPVSGVHVGTWHYAISSMTSYEELAWELLRWLTTREDTVGRFLLDQGRPSAILEFNLNREYLDINPNFPVIGTAMERAASLPFVPGILELMDEFELIMRRVLLDQAPLGPSLESFAEIQQRILDESLQTLGI